MAIKEIIKKIAQKTQIDNVQEASIYSINTNGTYNVLLRGGAIKQNAINLVPGQTYRVGDVVTLSMSSGAKESSAILGKTFGTRKTPKIVRID